MRPSHLNINNCRPTNGAISSWELPYDNITVALPDIGILFYIITMYNGIMHSYRSENSYCQIDHHFNTIPTYFIVYTIL